jgi:broad specificity phosphatase PhoE
MRLAPTLVLALVAACTPAAGRQAPAPAATVVVLVRHAEKAPATDADPALSAVGTARAEVLSALPELAGMRAVYVTQFQRTSRTAAPVAARRALAPIVRPISGDVGAYAAALAAEIRARPAGDTILVVGHSNSVPPIVAALGGPRLPNIDDASYDRLFVVTLDGRGGATLRESTYGAPSAAPASMTAPVRPR